MPKRLNPFGDSSPLQLKTHVGVKELATGSRQDELMKDVFAKTREKLFSGVQKTGNDINDNHMPSMALPLHAPVEAASRFEPMQMLLDGTGYLVNPLPITHNSGIKHCTDFNGWTDSGNISTSFRSQSPVTAIPAASGQLRLDANGYLTAPLKEDSMDCDGDFDPLSHGGGAAPCSFGSRGGSSGSGLHRFGFQSSKQASHKAGACKVLCESCRQIPGGRRCQFCERYMCQGCLRQCNNCSDYFCQLCSTINYDTSMERAFCLGCAG